MISKSIPRILIAGTNSGCGKTTITCAILSALVSRKISTASFKCGPDYIDPMFHGKIIGTSSSNLDPFFYDENTLNALLVENSEDISVIEGVMGFYDGITMQSAKGSSYDVARITSTPVILAVNCKGTAYSILPIIEGFAKHKTDFHLAGVILNQTSSTTYAHLKTLIETNLGISVFGYLPKLPPHLILESRHLGLVTPAELANIKDTLTNLGKFASATIDIDALIAAATDAPAIQYHDIAIEPVASAVIAVALDNAFCFYYKDSLNLFKKLGATLRYFSPLSDSKIPEDATGLYLGGGYPELYLSALSKNTAMKKSIQNWITSNRPTIAECGGFMYLTTEIDGFSMVAALEGVCHNTTKLTRFGYATFTATTNNILCSAGESFRGHEFHYYDCNNNGTAFAARKDNGKNWLAAYATENLYAGFPHISFYSNISIAKNFIRRCAQ